MSVCRLCGHNNTETAIDFGYQPIVHNLLLKPSENIEKFQFKLMHCLECDFLYLNKPISRNILYKDYFTVSGWKNQPHVSRLIDLMKYLANLNDKTNVLDIGCNDGSFLKLLYDKGIKNIKGIEPADDAYFIAEKNDFEVEKGFFGASKNNIFDEENKFELVITRHVLEHIIDLEDFLSGINIVLKNNGTLVIEIPDTSMNLQYLDYALWEEHVNYFTLSSISKLLNKFDLEIFHYEITLFSGRALTVFAKKNKNPINIFDYDLKPQIYNYIDKFPIVKEGLQKIISDLSPIAIYGCGARSSNFVNFLEINSIDFFIDDQIEKQNKFVPGSNLEIKDYKEIYKDINILLGVNAENENKVINKRNLDKKRLYSISPPSRYLLDNQKILKNENLD